MFYITASISMSLSSSQFPHRYILTEHNHQPQVKLDEDDVLGDILQDLGKQKNPLLPPPTKLRKTQLVNSSQSKPANPFSKTLSVSPMQVKTSPIQVKTTPKVLKPRNLSQDTTKSHMSPKVMFKYRVCHFVVKILT